VQRFVDEGPAPTFNGDSYFTELVRYIHLNPLRVDLVEDLRELEKYPYYGHATASGRGILT
jgi:putative transposase